MLILPPQNSSEKVQRTKRHVPNVHAARWHPDTSPSSWTDLKGGLSVQDSERFVRASANNSTKYKHASCKSGLTCALLLLQTSHFGQITIYGSSRSYRCSFEMLCSSRILRIPSGIHVCNAIAVSYRLHVRKHDLDPSDHKRQGSICPQRSTS